MYLMFCFKGLDIHIAAGSPVNTHSVQLQQLPGQCLLTGISGTNISLQRVLEEMGIN